MLYAPPFTMFTRGMLHEIHGTASEVNVKRLCSEILSSTDEMAVPGLSLGCERKRQLHYPVMWGPYCGLDVRFER